MQVYKNIFEIDRFSVIINSLVYIEEWNIQCYNEFAGVYTVVKLGGCK